MLQCTLRHVTWDGMLHVALNCNGRSFQRPAGGITRTKNEAQHCNIATISRTGRGQTCHVAGAYRPDKEGRRQPDRGRVQLCSLYASDAGPRRWARQVRSLLFVRVSCPAHLTRCLHYEWCEPAARKGRSRAVWVVPSLKLRSPKKAASTTASFRSACIEWR